MKLIDKRGSTIVRVTVVGTGYVGLVTGTCFAELGNEVVCIDNNAAKVTAMKAGKIPIYEPKLEDLFLRNISEGRLHFSTKLEDGLENPDVVFLALPTPPAENGEADLTHVLNVANDIGSKLKKYTVLVNKSTVPVGTSKKVRDAVSAKTKQSFDVVSNPEFLREGFAVDDFMQPDRIVIGSSSKKARGVMKKLYSSFELGGSQVLYMDEASAELTKYAANSFLATKISFMNEVAVLCEKVGADVDSVRRGIGTDERIGNRFLFSGIGYGGSCFPKDVWAMHKIAEGVNFDFKILSAVREVNEAQKQFFINKILAYYANNVKGKTFALWGLAFKPDTDDIREAPALTLMQALTKQGAIVRAFDPVAMDNVQRQVGEHKGLELVKDEYAALENADSLIIATEWEQFRTPDFKKMHSLLKSPVIFDGRNIYDPEEMKASGFHYESVGRQVVDLA